MTTTDEQRELDAIADELYAVRPDEFAAERDERIRKLKEDKKTALAKELAKLRRPTISAWLINLLWRDQREVMEQLFDLSQEMSRAQSEAAGPELRSLMTQRRQVESALLRQARVLARERGVEVTDNVEREAQETLGAALADPSVADEVRTGRLVKAVAYAGFGGALGAHAVVPSAAPRGAAAAPSEKRTPAESAREPADLRAAQRAKEKREAAERQVGEARQAVDEAAAELTRHERELSTAQRQQHQLRAQVESLEEQLRDLQQQVGQAKDDLAGADSTARTAARARDQAEKAHASALAALEAAQQSLAAARSLTS